MTERGQGAAPEPIEPTKYKNASTTGYFNGGNKRIDLVLVFKDGGSDSVKQARMNFLINALQLGLEAEVEPGKLTENSNLIFVKLHAPDEIIVEYGFHYDEKSFFKDSHLEFTNTIRICNAIRMKNERELIKIVRAHYPGPDNYSTLERSHIVYKILLDLPYDKNVNEFGINTLIQKSVFKDVFALHDGPYFVTGSSKAPSTNARQILFYEWLGTINVFKLQPIHLIHEYLGKRIAYFMAFYEYFNLMLIVPVFLSLFYASLFNVRRESEMSIGINPCIVNATLPHFVCPECRNYTLCPFIQTSAYCNEYLFLKRVDKGQTISYAKFIVFWGILFLIPWRYRENFLTWIWEVPKKQINKQIRSRYKRGDIEMTKKRIPGFKNLRKEPSDVNIWTVLTIVLTVALTGALCFCLFWLSILMWFYPRFKRLEENVLRYCYKDHEYSYIAQMAILYTVIVFLLKEAFIIVAQFITDLENNRRFRAQEMSIAIKLFIFCFFSSYVMINTFTFVGAFLDNYPKPFSYLVLRGILAIHSGIGSTLDDICIIVGIMSILEQVVFRIPHYLKSKPTDLSLFVDRRAPCWEREYRLRPITDNFFYKHYHRLAMQFGLITCYSMTFPLACLLVFLINIWDIRYTAQEILLTHRRPLLLNKSGPGFWKKIFLFIAHIAPLFNVIILTMQSKFFYQEYMQTRDTTYFKDYHLHRIINHDDKIYYPTYKVMQVGYKKAFKISSSFCRHPYIPTPSYIIKRTELPIRFVLYALILGVILDFFLRYVVPSTTVMMEDNIRKEKLIRNKFLIHKGVGK